MTDAPVIQAGGKAIADYVISESSGQFTTRFDLGTSQGAQCLDIQRIDLGPQSRYLSPPAPFQTGFQVLKNDVAIARGPQPGPRNYLVYVDNLPLGLLYGEAERWSTESAQGSLQNSGNLYAMLYGREGNDFFGSTDTFAAGTTSRNHLEFALHELTHTLGAVGPGAPHTSGAGHCNDENDILCYADGGPTNSLFTSPACDGASAPADPYGPALQAWDCNKDDYFSLNPSPGSYLGVNWNIANSDFLECQAASCPRPGIRPAVKKADQSAAQKKKCKKKRKCKKKKKKKRRR
jgi:hypothetical protein